MIFGGKKGLSGVIVTLILILLVLVAVGVVWVVVQNILESGTEQISLSQLTINMDVEKVSVESNGDVKVTVKRNAGEGELTGVNLIVSDGQNSEVIEKSGSIDELGTQTYTITQSELGSVGFVKSVSVAPLLLINDNTRTSDPIDELEINSLGLEDLTGDYGLISWWRLNGNSKDATGKNDGTINGNLAFTEGIGGQAGNFDGDDDSILISNDDSFETKDSLTWTAWFKCPVQSQSDTYPRILDLADNTVAFPQSNGDTLRFWLNIGGRSSELQYNNACDNTWKFFTGTWDGDTITLYIDGIEEGTTSRSGTLGSEGGDFVIGDENGGGSSNFLGQIDEVMVFNKALTKDEIKKIYNMKL